MTMGTRDITVDIDRHPRVYPTYPEGVVVGRIPRRKEGQEHRLNPLSFPAWTRALGHDHLTTNDMDNDKKKWTKGVRDGWKFKHSTHNTQRQIKFVYSVDSIYLGMHTHLLWNTNSLHGDHCLISGMVRITVSKQVVGMTIVPIYTRVFIFIYIDYTCEISRCNGQLTWNRMVTPSTAAESSSLTEWDFEKDSFILRYWKGEKCVNRSQIDGWIMALRSWICGQQSCTILVCTVINKNKPMTCFVAQCTPTLT